MNTPPRGLRAANLTWIQVQEAMQRSPTVLIPVGAACKEHGLHLPMNTDLIWGEYLVDRVLERCEVLALPTVTYGYYPAFVDYPGSVSISEAVFRDLIADICRSLARHGAKRFYVLNTGVSTIRPLKTTRAQLETENIAMTFTDLRKITTEARQSVEQQPFGTHADEIETSVMLYVAPQVVRMELAVPELAADRPGPLTRDPAGNGVYSASGAWGDPTLATAEKGKIVVEAMLNRIVREIEAQGSDSQEPVNPPRRV